MSLAPPATYRLAPLLPYTTLFRSGQYAGRAHWQLRLVDHPGRRASGSFEGQLQRVGDIPGPHGGTQLPKDDITGEVVEHGRQVHQAPADDLEVGEEIGRAHV